MSRWLLSPPSVRFVFFVERWLLSALFLYLGYEYLDTLRLMRLFAHSSDLVPQAMIARDGGFMDGIHFEDFARYILLALSNLACGVLLLIARKPTSYPTHAQEVVIPMLGTFFYLVFNQRVPLPLWMTTPFVPAAWTAPLAAVGLALAAAGIGGSLLAILWLGRSLGIVVSVRKVQLSGPYRFVRHPIYLAYLFLFAGLFLTACTVRMAALMLGGIVLMCWRARLEERMLAAHSPAYREWMKHTGFLWPRWSAFTTPRTEVEVPTSRAVPSSLPELAGKE